MIASCHRLAVLRPVILAALAIAAQIAAAGMTSNGLGSQREDFQPDDGRELAGVAGGGDLRGSGSWTAGRPGEGLRTQRRATGGATRRLGKHA